MEIEPASVINFDLKIDDDASRKLQKPKIVQNKYNYDRLWARGGGIFIWTEARNIDYRYLNFRGNTLQCLG